MAQNFVISCVTGDVLDDQEIAGKVEFFDDAEFMVELFWNARVGIFAIAFSCADPDELTQAAHLGFAFPQRVLRKAIVEVLECELTAFRDGAGREDPIRPIGEATYDLFSGMQMSLAVRGQMTPCRIERLAFAQANERIEQSSISGGGAAHITRGDDLYAARLCHGGRVPPDAFGMAIEEM